MMVYIVAIPVALLWFHSMYVLMEKYNAEEPFWLKVYLFLGAIYFVVMPTLAVKNLAEFFNFENGTSATIMGVVGTLLLLVLINKTPKKIR